MFTWFFGKNTLKGTMTTILEGDEYVRNGKAEKAIKLYNREIRKRFKRIGYNEDKDYFYSFPFTEVQRADLVKLIVAKANAYRSLFRFDRAASDYSSCIILDPENWRLYYLRGNVYGRDMGDYQAALHSYTKAIDLNPNVADIYNNRGLTYKALGYFSEALDDFNEGLKIEPDNDDIKFNRDELIRFAQAG